MKSSIPKTLFDFFCLASLVGIWPRWIEPNLLSVTKVDLPIKNLPPGLDGFKIFHFTDLHFSKNCSVQKKILRQMNSFRPDLIAFTGDFLSFSTLKNPQDLSRFLCAFDAPYGCFAVAGNHDYLSYVGINETGDYDVITPQKGFFRVFQKKVLSKKVTEQAKHLPLHPALLKALENSPFTLLHNETKRIQTGRGSLNIVGLGEHMLNQMKPEAAFQQYESALPGIVLSHNPDSISSLLSYPGDVLLLGHTHGAQINLPLVWQQTTRLENPQYKRGLFFLGNKWAYVNRGVGSSFPFRCFSIPEVALITLRGQIGLKT